MRIRVLLSSLAMVLVTLHHPRADANMDVRSMLGTWNIVTDAQLNGGCRGSVQLVPPKPDEHAFSVYGVAILSCTKPADGPRNVYIEVSSNGVSQVRVGLVQTAPDSWATGRFLDVTSWSGAHIPQTLRTSGGDGTDADGVWQRVSGSAALQNPSANNPPAPSINLAPPPLLPPAVNASLQGLDPASGSGWTAGTCVEGQNLAQNAPGYFCN